jgi:DNA-binding transcriptional MerR regulator
LRIGELASQVGLNPKTIRYYEDIGVLPAPERTEAGYRIYGEPDADRLLFIKTAQRLGITLDEIREILAFRDRGEQPCQYVLGVLRRERAEIDRRIAELRKLRAELVSLEAEAEGIANGAKFCRLIDHVRQKTPADGDKGTGRSRPPRARRRATRGGS